MDNPKVSVLIPMYNRKKYIADCIDSALNQTFQDYEIIVRDNCSTDGGYELIVKKYAKEIAEGKLKAIRNKENIGEWGNYNRLVGDAGGKYIMLLHSDDMILSHAVQHLYEVAENANADVVHASFFLNSPPDGVIKDISDCKPTCWEKNISDKLVTVPNDPMIRFNEWINSGTFIDAQYNLFNKEFILDNRIFNDGRGHRYAALWWIMTAKVLVKTPSIYYVRRDHPESGGRSEISPEILSNLILKEIELPNLMDKHFESIEFFRNNERLRYIAKSHLINVYENFDVVRHQIYKNGITPELYENVKNAFQKHFGDDYFYPMFLFNRMHVMPFGQRVDNIIPAPPPTSEMA